MCVYLEHLQVYKQTHFQLVFQSSDCFFTKLSLYIYTTFIVPLMFTKTWKKNAHLAEFLRRIPHSTP